MLMMLLWLSVLYCKVTCSWRDGNAVAPDGICEYIICPSNGTDVGTGWTVALTFSVCVCEGKSGS